MRVIELVMMRPPIMLTTRSAWSMTRWSWVTIRTVVRSMPSASFRSRESTIWPDSASSAAVGSSASTSAGRVHQGPRDRHPLALAAGELRRQVIEPLAQPELLEQPALRSFISRTRARRGGPSPSARSRSRSAS